MAKKKVESIKIEKDYTSDSVFDDADFVLDFPSKFKLVREKTGAEEYYSMFSKERVEQRDGTKVDKWKHVGYYGSVESGMKGYLSKVPNKALKGNLKVKEVLLFMQQLKKDLEL